MSSGQGLDYILPLVFGAVGLVIFTVTLLLGMALVGGIVDGLGGQASPTNTSAEPNPMTGEAVTFEDTDDKAEITNVYDVLDSRGYAVNLTGADDSYVQGSTSLNLSANATWSIGTFAAVGSGAASQNMTALSADGRVLIQYNGSTSNWSVWYYDESNRESYRVNVSATKQPGAYVWVEARHNGTHLTVYRNTTQGETVATDGSSLVDADTASGNWNGELDELRVFGEPLNSSQRSALVADPVGPLPNATRTARIMFDQGGGSTAPIYFAGTTAQLANHSWVDGLAGHALTDGTDYELDRAAGTITALADGRIDGAPVVFIDYRYIPRSDVASLANSIGPAFGLFGTSAILVPMVALLAVLVGGVIGSVGLLAQGRGGDDEESPFQGR